MKMNKWKKLPSVTREGKFFFKSTDGRFTVLQCWKTGNWQISIDGQTSDGHFSTSKEAMDACSRRIAKQIQIPKPKGANHENQS